MVIGLVGVLLFASPTISILAKLPPGQHFSEIYLLGPHFNLDNFPFNIQEGVKYLIYVGVGNNLDRSSYYTVYLKMEIKMTLFPINHLVFPANNLFYTLSTCFYKREKNGRRR